jgi:hypothetical protein
VQPDHGVEEQAQLVVVLVGPAKQVDIQSLQTRARGAPQLRREDAAALVIGLQTVRVMTVGPHVLQEGVPRRLVERILLQGQPGPSFGATGWQD